MAKIKTIDLFSFENTLASEILKACEYPWQILDKISSGIIKLGTELSLEEFDKIGEDVWVHKTANVAKTSSVVGPCIIDAGAEIRHCAYIRGNCLIGKKAVLGNSCEAKNTIMMDGSQAPHFNYLGDSILGYRSHIGAGVKTSNLKSDKSLVVIRTANHIYTTGRKKVGAILGDDVEVGCNTVLCPGSVVGKKANIYPLCCVRGFIKENSILKTNNIRIDKENK